MDEQATATADDHWSAALAAQAVASRALLVNLAVGVLRDRPAAEDAAQRAMLAAWERRASIADPARLRAWLATAVVNESLAVVRRRAVERRALPTLAAATVDGGAATDGGERRDAVLLAMADLPDDERAAVAMRVMQGLSGREAADVLGVSQGQVSKLLHRGMERLRSSLADWA